MDEQGNTHVCLAPASALAPDCDALMPTYFIVLRGGIPGSMLEVGPGENWLGRAADNSIQLSDPTISRHHALLDIEPDGRAIFHDQGSTNGSYVNNCRLPPHGSIELHDGDRVRIGSHVVLKFSRPDPCEENYQRELFERAVRDHLTGLYNRSFFLERVGMLAQQSASEGIGLAVLLLDVDHFKRVNDTYGHDAGDAVLREVAAVLRQSTRSEDLVARYGGEEFIIALPCPSMSRAVERAEAIRRKIEARQFRLGDGSLEVTASIGVAYAGGGRPKSPSALITRADLHLYQAKEAGRNCVACLLESVGDPEGQPTTDGEAPPTEEQPIGPHMAMTTGDPARSR